MCPNIAPGIRGRAWVGIGDIFSPALQKSSLSLRKLESEKSRIQREMGPVLAKKPLGPSASALPLKFSAASNKIDDINNLIGLYDKK